MTATDLFFAARSGRPEAWERLVRHYGPLVQAVPRRMGLEENDVDEVFQATWIALHRHLPEIKKPAALASWIATTAAREAARLRRNRRRQEYAEASASTLSSRAGPEAPEEIVERLERVQRVRDAVDALGERCRDLLTALHLSPGRKSYEEVAGELGIPMGSIGPTRLRCLAKLARILGRELDG